ncbi:MAG: glycosyltransferase [Minisyncoccia bacterium]|jgi:dolichyl-phosphate beta-glucosyltransferase
MKPLVSIIVPACENPKQFPLTLLDVDKKLSEADYSYEILVVGDDSAPGTADTVNRFGHLIKDLKFIDGKGGRNMGGAVRKGMLAAKGSYRLFIRAGGIPVIGKFEETLSCFKDGFQVITDSDDFSFGCFTEEAALRIFGIARINGRGFMKEALALAQLFGFRVKKMKIGTGTHFASGIHPAILWDAIRIRYWLRRGAYATLEKPVL